MEKLKCTSCGGHLQVEDNKEYAVCDHCGARYKLNEDLNINIKLDDNMKEILNGEFGTMGKNLKFMVIPAIAFFCFIIIVMVISSIDEAANRRTAIERQKEMEESMKKQQEIFSEQFEKGQEKINENMKSIEDESDKDMFNLQFELENGTQNAFFLKSTLDKIIRSNNKYDRKVTLVINGIETTNEQEIVNIKQSLDGDYEVSISYGDDGYINKVIVNKN